MCFPPAEAETRELLETALEQAREVREQLFQCSRRGSGPVQVSPSHWRFISTQACRNDERVAFLQLVGVSAERLLCLEALDMVGYQSHWPHSQAICRRQNTNKQPGNEAMNPLENTLVLHCDGYRFLFSV